MSEIRLQVENASVDIDRYPDRCPLCHRSLHVSPPIASALAGTPFQYEKSAELRLVFRCPSHECSELFIAYYVEEYSHQRDLGTGEFRLEGLSPQRPSAPKMFKGISQLSPRFAAIYSQALAAEGYRLTEVAGGGLRKALEFLIKDFCINGHPDQADESSARALPTASLSTSIIPQYKRSRRELHGLEMTNYTTSENGRTRTFRT
jgi:hypothetical protein